MAEQPNMPMAVDRSDARRSEADDEKAFDRWHKRFDSARRVRSEYVEKVWRKLYEGWIGSLMRFQGDADVVNGFAQHVAIVMPHLVGDNRECRAKVSRIAAHEQREEKIAFAEQMGDQATALLEALGCYVDIYGKPGEIVRAIYNAMWSVGVLVFGFEQQRGLKRAKASDEADNERRIVDLDFAAAEHQEQHDAGMPWVRCYSPLRFLGDGSYNDFAKGRWFAIESYMSVAEARARWPEHEDKWKRTHKSVPTWEGAGASTESGDTDKGDEDGLVCFYHAYERDPQRRLIVPHRESGVRAIVETTELDLGFEGLPLLLLGSEWPEAELYPMPFLAQQFGPAAAENEYLQTVFGAGRKLKTATVVNEQLAPGLAKQLRKGHPSGVYSVKNLGAGGFDQLLKTIEAGAVRREHIELAEQAHKNWERASGHADLQLGRREPGKPTATEVDARQNHISTRMAGLIKPVRQFESAACMRILAIAYAKAHMLHGLQLPIGNGPNVRFAVFDANRPMLGEALDYAFEVQTSDALTDADELNASNILLQTLMGIDPYLQQRGKMVQWEVLVEGIVRKSRIPNADEVIVDMPPPEPAPPMAAGEQGTGNGEQYGTQAEPEGAPMAAAGQAPGPQETAPPDVDQLYAMLAELPEGDPREEEILRMIAELEAQGEAVAA